MSVTGGTSDRIPLASPRERRIGQGTIADLRRVREAHALRNDFRRAGLYLTLCLLSFGPDDGPAGAYQPSVDLPLA
jgi:hypothetical protein